MFDSCNQQTQPTAIILHYNNQCCVNACCMIKQLYLPLSDPVGFLEQAGAMICSANPERKKDMSNKAMDDQKHMEA